VNSYEGQDGIFFREEGDRWFQRNRDSLKSATREDRVLKALDGLLEDPPEKVLEVGAANGFRLAALNAEYGCQCVAVEPSIEAIESGKKCFSSIDFRRGIASEIPRLPDEQFDLVIVSFVLHWVGRSSLARAIAEIDSSVQNGGYLVISDFMPDQPTSNPYHHRADETMTFKQDYSASFTSLGIYETVKKCIGVHGSEFDKSSESDRRIATFVMRKNTSGLYIQGSKR